MAKIKDAIIDGTYHQEKVYRDAEEREYRSRQLLDPELEPKETVSNWYAEYIKHRNALSEVEDLTDEWRENQPGFGL